MHRFYLPSPPDADRLRLTDREAHHALQVLRLKRGETVAVLDGVGHEFLCELESSAKDSLSLIVKETRSTPPVPCPVTLFVAIPKGKIIESIIQKSVELGARRIVPLLTERVISQLDGEGAEHKREKWRQVAIEAIKQCGARWLPEVEAPAPLAARLTRGEIPELSLVGSLQTERRHPREWIAAFQNQHGRRPHSAGVWIGPEGDFTLEELTMIEAAGARPITLGDLTLRVETAAIYGLAILSYELSG
jgi:16S rRNA (uracil1498-N3)-methyltransferase